jgi:GNAT superfamily N-acetyltransferase
MAEVAAQRRASGTLASIMSTELNTALARVTVSLLPGLTGTRLEALMREHRVVLTRPGGDHVAWHAGEEGDVVVAVASRGQPQAWLLGWCDGSPRYDALTAVENAVRRADEVVTVVTGGPPWHYLVSGVDARAQNTRAWFERAGYARAGEHVDLEVDLARPAARDARVRRARRDEGEALVAWVARGFAHAWGEEVRRALAHDASVFVAEGANGYAGFSAHSGHNAALGTFGPLGVAPEARRNGLGAALARAALDDLAARGFACATIPWVDPALVGFYARLAEGVRVVPRVVLRKTLPPSAAARGCRRGCP